MTEARRILIQNQGKMKTNNKLWAYRIICKLNPSFLPRWQVFNHFLCRNSSYRIAWFNTGCGYNAMNINNCAYLAISFLPQISKDAKRCLLVCAEKHKLPPGSEIGHPMTLRFITEYLSNINEDSRETTCILKLIFRRYYSGRD